MPGTDCGTPGRRRPYLQPIPYYGFMLPYTAGFANGTQSPLGWHGRYYGNCFRFARLLLSAAKHLRADRADAQAEWVCHVRSLESVTKFPYGETSPAGPFDAWPTGGGGFEYFYGFIGEKRTNGIRRFMRVRRPSKYIRRLKKATT